MFDDSVLELTQYVCVQNATNSSFLLALCYIGNAIF